MVSPALCVDTLTALGFGPWIGVPCSYLKPFINYVMDASELEYLAANNEGEAIAIAAGAWLAGKRPVVMFQNSGLGNAVNPLTSLVWPFRIPLLLVVTWRGEPGRPDEPQHELMGQITPALLDLMQIPLALFPGHDDDVAPAAQQMLSVVEQGSPFAWVMREGTVLDHELAYLGRTVRRPPGRLLLDEGSDGPLPTRASILSSCCAHMDRDTLLVATTGKTGRELFTLHDRDENFYVVGSMGCATSIGLGLARFAQHRPVMVLDGDGAALMRLEAMVGVGAHGTPNLTHVILDNQVHESTGGQPTLSSGVDFAQVALACGYRSAVSVSSVETLESHWRRCYQESGPHLLHVRIQPGSLPHLGRPTRLPHVVAQRFREVLLQAVR